MCAAIEHRGPDGEGYFDADSLSVGMRRLSIIDIEGGSQPIWASPYHGIIFNGEIYNYASLRDELRAQGHVFETRSDTEVVVRLYMQEGMAFLSRLNGMFTLCVIDLEQRKTILARDRFGEKPLYYADKSDFFYFASELKAFKLGMETMPSLNKQALSHYLSLRFVPEAMTMWQGIHKLPPGHYITFDLDTLDYACKRYWQPDFNARPFTRRRDYVSEFGELFYSSVHQRIHASDAPVGILLSGGLDSTLITHAAKETGHDALHTFSIGNADPRFSESEHAEFVAKYYGTRHQTIQYSYETFLHHLPDYVWDTDEPLGDSASIPLRYMCRFAREKVKVALTGEGADELFGGYDMDRTARKAQRFARLLRYLPRSIFSGAAALHNKQSNRGRAFAQMAKEGWGAYLTSIPAHPTSFWKQDEKAALFPSLAACEATPGLIRGWYSLAQSQEPLDKLMSVMSHGWLVEDLLMKADKMSMSESLELRCPFLDYPLAEWAQRLPMTMRFGDPEDGFTTKAVLRRFAAGRIPDRIINRQKQGFPDPTCVWMEQSVPQWLALIQAPDAALVTVLGMPADIDFESRFGISQSERNLEKLWLLVLLELWLRRWVLDEDYATLSDRIHDALS